ncbi:MAG: PAS domain S-box protein [Bdellovibrionales bacterium]
MSQKIAPPTGTAETEVRSLRPTLLGEVEMGHRFRLLVESVSDYAIFLLDPDGYIQTWNAGAEQYKGYSAEEAIGKHFSIFYTREDTERRHPQHVLKTAREAGRFEDEGWRLRKDGTQFWANVVITRLTGPDGTIVGFAKVTRDFTAKKTAVDELRLSEERYRLLVSAVKDYAIFMLDPKGRVATWNDGAQKLKGYVLSEILGQHFSKFYPPEDIRSQKPQWELEEAAVTGRFEDEGWRVRKDGTRFWANVVITAVRNPAGTLIGYSKVTRDMTDRRRLEEKLRRANEDLDERVKQRTEQLEKAVRARDEFMSIVSHELRTPVTSLKLQVQTALRQLARSDVEGFSERTVKFAQGAEKQLDRLSRLIDDMLDMSRISMDRLNLDLEPLNLCEVVRETVARFEEQSHVAGCQLTCEARGTVEMKGDRHRLDQVFSNLLMNALKYGSGKPVSVSVTASRTKVFVEVEDQGMGIALKDQARIFERFERAVSASRVSGMGLGLYISRNIVEGHGGRISVQSELGKGSTFIVELPLNLR